MSAASSGCDCCRVSMLTVNRSYKVIVLLIFITHNVYCFPNQPADAGHMTANAGQNIVFNCEVEFPGGLPVPYVVQWWKKGKDLPIYIWYDNYPTHADKDYAGRVSKIEPDQSSSSKTAQFGLASLNITSVSEKDRGWYNCRVLFLNRNPDPTMNGTWYHLDVHAPPYFIQKPEELVYVSPQDSIILNCQAGGTPTPEIVWFKGDGPVKLSERVGVFNDGTELRINNILERDLGEYTCIARNGVGNEGKNRIHFTTRVVMAGGAIITKRPSNITVQEGQGAEFPCEGEANPRNVSVKWYKDGIPLSSISELEHRTATRKNGTLVFSKVKAGDEGRYTCEITNGIGRPIDASAHLSVEYSARVSFQPDVQFIPRGLQGIIHCHIEANPPIQFVTWTKNKRIFDPFDEKGVMAIENGSIIIDKVGVEHVGDYVCTPYNIHGSAGPSKVMHVKIKNPPELTRRPDQEYHRSVGDKITLPCGAIGTPTPEISWRRVDGQKLPRNRHRVYNGELTIDNLRKTDHGVYECVVHNTVATIVVRTEIFIERTTPHAPTNLTVTNSETFAVTIEWLPGYSGCASCSQTYKIRYREKDSKFPNWIELPVNPPDARKIQIHHLNSRTKYEFQVIGTNEFGDGMYSEIIEAQTKADGGLEWSVYAPTASPSEQSTSNDCQGRLKKGSAPATATRKLLSSDCIEFNLEITGQAPGAAKAKNDPDYLSVFDIKLLPTDNYGRVIYPRIPKHKDIPPGEAPGAATNLTLTQEAGGWVLRWNGPPDDAKLIYYTVQIKKDSQGDEWLPLTDSKIDVEEASYMIKNMGTAKAYLFRVFSHSPTSYSISEELKYDLPENVKRRAVTAGLIGGILFFIVAIVLSVCTVKICNKRRRRKQERAYNMVACRITDARNGGQISQVPLKRPGKSRVPAMRTFSSNGGGLLSFYDQVTNCIHGLEDRLEEITTTNRTDYWDEPDYSDGRRRSSRLPARKKIQKYSLHVEYPTQPGHRGLISRSKDGRFILDDDDDEEGGFGTNLPPNRFRTRSVAIVAGYSPERLYSNMPPGAFVVESGVYKVGADREWERPEPIYWRQVVFGSQQPQQRQVSRLGEEDLRRLRALELPSSSDLIRTSNLELLRPEAASLLKLRASSPLDQQVPLVEWMSPIHNYSDVSSVSHRERSLPSTMLTNSGTFSSAAAMENTSRSLRQLHTIPEHLPPDEEAPPAYSVVSGPRVVQADIHQRAEDPYFTYRNADAMFPNYALNYPAPIHPRLSPSRQYPPPQPVQIVPSSYWQSLYVQPDPRDFAQDPLATSSPPPFSTHDYENMQYRRQRAASAQVAPRLGGITHQQPAAADQTSLVSEVLDAEVTALTNSSSPGGSSSNSSRLDVAKAPQAKKRYVSHSSPELSSSSGIASKNTSSQNQTSSSSTSVGSQLQLQKHSPAAADKTPLEPIFESSSSSPFYENWPPKHPPPVRPRSSFYGIHYMQPLSIVTKSQEEEEEMLPPLTPHQTLGLSAKPQTSRGLDRRLDAVEQLDVSLPPSRPGSAPMLDVSIDRHYEFDSRTPTDDLNMKGIREALPLQWNRPYLGYNPRQREREMGAAAQLARTERVFSDSEIYSPVFPRGRPESKVDDVSARVKAMKKEFQEYRQLQLQQQEGDSAAAAPTTVQSSPVISQNDAKEAAAAAVAASDRLESLI